MLGREGGKSEVSIILEGSVARTSSQEDAANPPERLGPGAFIGYELIVEPRLPLGSTFQALDNTTTLVVPQGLELASCREAA
eukprot:813021-Prymnesium_polylepis.2